MNTVSSMQGFASLATPPLSTADADLCADCSPNSPHKRRQRNGVFQRFDDNILSIIASYSCQAALRAVNKDFARLAPLPLNKRSTQKYIDNVKFRNSFNERAGSRGRVRLNLGGEYERYIVNGNYRDRINRLVENPETQIWRTC
jgi:hypothetical protein